jgi:hypothetical protein
MKSIVEVCKTHFTKILAQGHWVPVLRLQIAGDASKLSQVYVGLCSPNEAHNSPYGTSQSSHGILSSPQICRPSTPSGLSRTLHWHVLDWPAGTGRNPSGPDICYIVPGSPRPRPHLRICEENAQHFVLNLVIHSG